MPAGMSHVFANSAAALTRPVPISRLSAVADGPAAFFARAVLSLTGAAARSVRALPASGFAAGLLAGFPAGFGADDLTDARSDLPAGFGAGFALASVLLAVRPAITLFGLRAALAAA